MKKAHDTFNPEQYFTLTELLEYLRNQYSKWTVYKWVSQGMPHLKVRGKLWFPKDEMLSWLKIGC